MIDGLVRAASISCEAAALVLSFAHLALAVELLIVLTQDTDPSVSPNCRPPQRDVNADRGMSATQVAVVVLLLALCIARLFVMPSQPKDHKALPESGDCVSACEAPPPATGCLTGGV
eukprot:m51a1_g7576 hypothetical protein (117) ;mRNA; r:181486-182263